MGNRRIYLGRETGKYATIAGGAIITITSLFFVLMALGFEITGSDDFCLGTLEDPCISYGTICNLGPDNYDIYNPDSVKMDFSPTIKDYWIFFKDGRVKKEFLIPQGINHSTRGWRYENFTDATKPRKDRIYVHRFARYTCQNYMLVGLKENPNDIIKWGMGIGGEYLDPFWYGLGNATANISVTDSISLELGSKINLTMNIPGASTVCVDIDHPEYGDNYTCGSPNATFLFNISYFRTTTFNDSTTYKNIDPGVTINTTCGSGCTDYFEVSSAYEVCTNLTIDTLATFEIQTTLHSSWAVGESNPLVKIRDSETNLLETIEIEDRDIVYALSSNLYAPGIYGFCLQHQIDGESVGMEIPNGGTFEVYGVNVTTGEIVSPITSRGVEWVVRTASETLYIDSHQFDEPINFSLSITGINEPTYNLKFFLNDTLVKSIPFLSDEVNGTTTLFNDSSLVKEYTFNGGGLDVAYINLPFGSIINHAFVNLSGNNNTWALSTNANPVYSYSVLGSPASGTPYWRFGDQHCVDGSFTGLWCEPANNPANGDNFDSYIYENYTIESTATEANWTSSYNILLENLEIDIHCWNGAWSNILSYTCPSGFPGDFCVNVTEVAVTATCLDESELQIRTTLEYDDFGGYVAGVSYVEGRVKYSKESSPANASITVDGDNYSFTGTLVSEITPDFSSSLQSAIDTCTADDNGNCIIPIYVATDDGGKLNLSNLNVSFSINNTVLIIDADTIENYLNQTSSGPTELPLIVGYTSGDINLTDLKFDYAGGNDTVEILVWNSRPVNPIFNFSGFASPENLIFTGDQNITRNITVNRNSVFFNAVMNVSGARTTSPPSNPFISVNETQIWNFTGNFFFNESTLIENLTNYFNFDEQDTTGSGIIIDFVGNNNATNNGASNSSGKILTAYDYDGVDNFINLTLDSIPIGGQNRTFNLWIISDDITSFQDIVTYGDPGVATKFFHFRQQNNGKLFFQNSPTSIEGNETLTQGAWEMVTMTYESSTTTVRLYQNATLVAEGSMTLDTGTISPLRFGIFADAIQTPWNGSIDEAGIWNKTLNQSEITELWAEGQAFSRSEWIKNGTAVVGNFSSVLNTALNSAACDCIGCSLSADDCTINFTFHSDTAGNLTYSDLNISYTLDLRLIDNETFNIINYFSNWNFAFPSNIDFLEFIPRLPTSKNVTPYGQSFSRPILNITNYGYGGKNSNFSIHLNETFSCVNLTYSTESSKVYFEKILTFDTLSGQGGPVGELSTDRKEGTYSYNTTTGRTIFNQIMTWTGDDFDASYYVNASDNKLGDSYLTIWVKIEDCSLTTLPSGKCTLDSFEFGNQNTVNQTNWDVDLLYDYNLTSGVWEEITLYFNDSSYQNVDTINWSEVDYIETYSLNNSLIQTRILLDDLRVYGVNNTKYLERNFLNATWHDVIKNLAYLDSVQIWMWADYECSFTTWRLWAPVLSFRNCAEDAICSEELT